MISSQQASTWASWFRALGDPTRIELLHVLATAGEPMKVGALVERLGIAQSTVSHHLGRLSDAGFVRLRRDGPTTWCEVNRRCFAGLPGAASAIMGQPERTSGEAADPRDLSVRPLDPADWPAVRQIYAAGIATGDATFEEEPPSWEDFDAHRIAGLRFVAVAPDQAVVGWVAASPVSDRCAYAGVIEHSVYVDPGWQRRGAGRLLLEHLIRASESAGIWTIQSGVFPENTASRALHGRCGFREVGLRERVGRHHGRWRDVVMLERRSPTVS
ncbi:MAG TPA: metalloregulator ArsR/SmtB family transcription factor [Candidatus Binatia bacterium]|nr:metalloregulator ArsR/SmtB family transcription factor [Candidatus Binatia bacterium]